MARLASSSPASSAPPIRCTFTPAACSGASSSRSGSWPAHSTTLSHGEHAAVVAALAEADEQAEPAASPPLRRAGRCARSSRPTASPPVSSSARRGGSSRWSCRATRRACRACAAAAAPRARRGSGCARTTPPRAVAGSATPHSRSQACEVGRRRGVTEVAAVGQELRHVEADAAGTDDRPPAGRPACAQQHVDVAQHAAGGPGRGCRGRAGARRWRGSRRRSAAPRSDSASTRVFRCSRTPRDLDAAREVAQRLRELLLAGNAPRHVELAADAAAASYRCTSWPRSASVVAAASPAGPAPTTAMRFFAAATAHDAARSRGRRAG